jgi:hypothetical protein
MANFKQSERAQGLFLTVNLEDQLIPGTLEWTVDYLIDEFDMSLFEQNYHKENVTAKALAENNEPDHATIAAFISTNSEAVKDLFAQVLMQCNKLKLTTGGMFAVDGCKPPSNASKECSGKIEELKKKRSISPPCLTGLGRNLCNLTNTPYFFITNP